MKKNLVYILFCSVLIFGFAYTASAEGDQDFTVVNKTGVTIDSLYVSAVSENDWEEDILGADTLADGEEIEIAFDAEEGECKWDIMIKDTNGKEFFWRNVDLCEVTTLTLHYEKGKAWATKE